jgi:hypothetical protein
VNQVLKRAKFFFGGQEPERPPTAAEKKAAMAFHAVVVKPGRHACGAARALKGRRFLSKEAPILPLRNCDSDECECHYEHYEDRRAGPRRARELGVAIDGHDGEEKRSRQKRGRRNSDR